MTPDEYYDKATIALGHISVVLEKGLHEISESVRSGHDFSIVTARDFNVWSIAFSLGVVLIGVIWRQQIMSWQQALEQRDERFRIQFDAVLSRIDRQEVVISEKVAELRQVVYEHQQRRDA